ncbi:hypothetical protein NX059_006077 [Plenodomus lindquistii]|nr:hypothetical protein NX059_006077 [Plenodomus lindquistii]
MEPAAAGVLYAAEHLLEGAVALVKGITHPTLPIKARLTHITSVLLPRSQHTIAVVKGRAYIFGGEVATGKLADNTMHVVILPSSGVLEADYTTFAARAENGLDDVPGPRKGHTAVVIGDSIYVFGGQGEESTNEKGRVWVYSTVSNTWSHLDPASGTTHPGQRTGHASASSELLGPRTTTYREKAPQAPADPAKFVPEPAEADSWGTIFVTGGRDTSSGELLSDALAFDVRTKTWTNIPSPPECPGEGASLSLVGEHLYLLGGKGTMGRSTSVLTRYLDASHAWQHAEGGTTPLSSGWAWRDVKHVDKGEVATVKPRMRSFAGTANVTTGQGRHYLLALGGEAEDGSLLGDVWALQLAPERATAAAMKDGIRASIKQDTHESQWAEVTCEYVDAKGEEEKEASQRLGRGLGARGYFATAKGTEVDGATCVVWGGVNAGNVLGDGWLLTVDR